MRKKPATTAPKKKHPKPMGSLLKTGKKGHIELTEKELEKVSGGLTGTGKTIKIHF